MVKKKQSTKTVRSGSLWPSRVTPLKVLVVLSVALNIALVVILCAMHTTDIFDRQIVKDGFRVYCSQEYRDDLNSDALATNDYACGKDEAKSFYLDGLNEYRATKSLSPVED